MKPNYKGREEIVKILMKRDNITREEAEDLVEQCVDALITGNDEAIYDYLGLEDDYIFDII